jgi:predicted nucleic acid-binding protein
MTPAVQRPLRMVVVDTSVWVAALRDDTSCEADRLRALLEDDLAALAAPVRVEILAGSRRSDLPRLRRVFSALPCWFPDRETWSLIDTWIDRTVDAGERFGVADLVIAAIAEQRGAELWSLDRDFQRLARLELVRLHLP